MSETMDHQQARQWLNDYVDGELSPDRQQQLEAYLDSHPRLQEELADLRRLQNLAAQLPEEIQPQRDLWPGIAEIIAPERQPVHPEPIAASDVASPERMVSPAARRFATWRPYLAAAAVVILVLMAAFYSQNRGRFAGRDGEVQLANEYPQAWSQQATQATLAALELECLTFPEPATSHLGLQHDVQSVISRGLLEQNLRIVDLAIAEVGLAWSGSPQSTQLTRLLRNAYRTRADLQRRITELSLQV